MPLSIRSEEVNRLAEELAAKRHVTKTEAVKLALVNELQREQVQKTPMERIREIQDRVAALPKSGLEADKAFYDSLNDE
ncbi:type II toxin-antitoxin system VapB family antitoxin [Kaistia dalseonensis]|uniref:Antitoxin VapB n=1 Tax=Kaistia dalseonensis TaxID=410840 RepID=A0ABU0HD29_9HYPH|nr:type II toxin-antitoxin system VapB family antitoxin [Kaistia dalseonensis]MCX5497589.1 type II toxin-antitoxin system VapB family antitoxin [Kaistia dalseonensis]MDQ0440229.1 antitoxin VapB [Kaistia dalseonensis]